MNREKTRRRPYLLYIWNSYERSETQEVRRNDEEGGQFEEWGNAAH